MAVLSWQHTRSRTKSGSEKTHLSRPQEWFARTTSEPSRQALTSLVKAHKREKSDECNTSKSRSRSRGNTVTSVEWQKERPRAGSASEDIPSRPPSSYHTREGSIYSTFERSEGATKALLAKGGLLLKRSGSKMSLSSGGSSSTLGYTSPSRSTTSMSNHARSEEIRNKISVPFDFQHVTHTEQNHFVGLGRIEETDLAQQFTAIAHRQSAATELRGIEASDLSPTDSTQHSLSSKENAAKILDAPLPQLPATPPRPAPPSKSVDARNIMTDASPASKAIVSSIHPNPKSSTYPLGISLSNTKDTYAPSRPNIHTEPVDLNAKPLPQLPIIHAVTTEDDIARELIAAPLPTPPCHVSSAAQNEQFHPRSFHTRQQSSLALRHMSFYPAAKSSMPNLLQANQLTVAPHSLPRHHSDMALSQQAKNRHVTGSVRASMSFGAIDTMNWEDAVDEAWDDVHENCDVAMSMSQSGSFEAPQSSSFASEDGISAVSTPLMMASAQRTAAPADCQSLVAPIEVHKLEAVQEDEYQTDLAGLGISSCPPSSSTPTTPYFSRSSSTHYPKRRSSLSCVRNDSLTRSSSQESIILSIASSINGTQRSSSSSLSADDLMNVSRISEKSSTELNSVDMDQAVSVTARPESGCLPSDIYEQISKLVSNDIPNAPASPAKTTRPLPPLPELTRHMYSKSTPKVAVPERRSSIASTEQSWANRKRANTAGARPRANSRMSYSLFPITPTVAAPSPSSASSGL